MSEFALEIEHLSAADRNGAAQNLTLRAAKGELFAVLGDADGGGSALFNALIGRLPMEQGAVYLNGGEVRVRHPSAARRAGLGWIAREGDLADEHTVLEHLTLLPGMGGSKRRVREKAEKACEEYALDVEMDVPAKEMTLGERFRGEMLREILGQADVILIEEPSFSLTPLEMKSMEKTWRQIAKQGRTILLFTRFPEIAMLADQCAVLRRGTCKDVANPKEKGIKGLEESMYGGPKPAKTEKREIAPGSVVLEVRDLKAKAPQSGMGPISRVSFEARSGEITVICGLKGSGKSALAFALAGLIPCEEGRVRLKGGDLTRATARERIQAGIGFAPGAQMQYGLSEDTTLAGNMALRSYRDTTVQEGGMLRFSYIRRGAAIILEKMNTGLGESLNAATEELKTEEKQKAALAREISRNPDVLIALNPVRDMNAWEKRRIWSMLLSVRSGRQAVLLLTEDIEEALALADRLLVMHRGEIVGVFDPHLTTAQEIGMYASQGRRQGGEEEYDEE
ncbi:MAG: ATP-binding cassette domain-containing protein [Clostridia bacterium]|nr:ATP-binding cassette domain-containing protein [Clostridia bacterium]